MKAPTFLETYNLEIMLSPDTRREILVERDGRQEILELNIVLPE